MVYNVSGTLAPSPTLCNWSLWNGTSCVLNASRWDAINFFAEKVTYVPLCMPNNLTSMCTHT